ncbi:hypothetical protein MHU86_11046 [Fragilaria crotonensis]|nr:hypothetical protein MHU86_11046 [Fragilaria crotonensis]
MALRVNRPTSEQTNRKADSYLETMKKHAVSEKPKVKQLGASSTPVTKKNLLNFSVMPEMASVPDLSSMDCVPQSARKAVVRKRPWTSSLPTICTDSSRDEDMIDKPVTKKRRTSSSKSSYQFMQQREELLSPPPPGASLSYQQKQYQSVWLAVPPKIENFSRRPPRERPPIDSIPKRRQATKKLHQGSSPGAVAGLTNRGAAVKAIHKKATARNEVLTGQMITPGVVEATGAQRPTGKSDENKENVSSLLLKKQKAPSLRRHLPNEQNFFNKVVKVKGTKDASYFFALHFDMEKMELEVLPMAHNGVLGGKRSGRPKWKVQVNSRSTVLTPTSVRLYHVVLSNPPTSTISSNKMKNHIELDVRNDVRRKSAARTITKKQHKNVAKTPASKSQQIEGKKRPVIKSSDDDDDDDDDDVASSKV